MGGFNLACEVGDLRVTLDIFQVRAFSGIFDSGCSNIGDEAKTRGRPPITRMPRTPY